MTKSDLVNIVSERTGLTKLETEIIVDGFIEAIIAAMKAGERIEIRGFGIFNVKKRNRRISQHPKTGEKIILDDCFVPTFKISKDFRNAVNEKLQQKKLLQQS